MVEHAKLSTLHTGHLSVYEAAQNRFNFNLKMFRIFCRLVQDLQKCTGDVRRDIIDETILKLSQYLHPNHYLNLLAKRHLIVIDAKNLYDMDIERLQQRKKLCEEVTLSDFITKSKL